MVAKQQEQFVQCFQLTMDDLKTMIKEAVKSVIPTPSKDIDGTKPEDDLISPKETCEILKISSTSLWRYNTVTGILKPKTRIGRKVYYSRVEVYNLINQLA